MPKRREDIDDSDVRFMYEVEGMTQKEIAEYYGVGKSTIWYRLHPETSKRYYQTENGKAAMYRNNHSEKGIERRKRFAQTKKHINYVKQWYLEHPEYNKDYYDNNKESILEQKEEYRQLHPEYSKEWYAKHPGYKKEWRQTNNGKESTRRMNAKHRQLGYIELNKPFPDSEGHHIDEVHVLNIPKKLHRSIRHNVWTDEGMEAINEIAFGYITEETFDKLLAGEI